jgi:hypothetical protein
LLEPSRSNIVPYSSIFSIWTQVNGASVSDTTDVISPDGTLNAELLVSGGNGNVQGIYKNISFLNATTYTMSVFAKKKEISFIQLQGGGAGWSGNTFANFDLENGIVGNIGSGAISSSIENYGNGWYRCSFTATKNASGGNLSIDLINSATDGRDTSYNGNIGDGFYIYGVQAEANSSYATSYIPTQGSIVTRLADNIDTDFGTILPLSGEVSVYMEMLGQPVNETNVTGKISAVNFDDTTDSSSYVSLNFNGTDWRARVQAVGGSRFVSFEVDQTETIKALFVLRPTSYALYANGNLIGSEDRLYNEPAPVINEIAKVEFDNSTSDKGITRNKDLRVYNTALSNAEAIALTTL